MNKQCATIDLRNKQLFLSTKTSGPALYVGVGSPTVLDIDVGAARIGSELLAVLARSVPTSKIDLPEDLSEVAIPLYKAAGVTTWRQFVKGCRSIRAERNGKQLELQMLKRDGLNLVLGSKSEILKNPTSIEIGEAIERMFRLKGK